MPRKIAIILNKNSGTGQLPEKFDALKEACRKHGLEPEIFLVGNGEEASERAREAAGSGFEIVAGAGGDGTLSAVAAGVLDTGAKLGVLPLGTFNHFAADLGIPPDLEGALNVLRDGVSEEVDVGEVNRQIFLNNSSVGLYPRMVHEKEEEMGRNGRGRVSAYLRAFWKVIKKYPSLILKMRLDGADIRRNTSFVFVGNNEYILEGLRMGRREGLKNGYLDIGVAHHTERRDLIRIFTRAFFGRLGGEPYFEEYRVQEAKIDSRRRFLPVSLDGEVKVLRTPLNFRIRPKALKVILPRPA